MHRAVQESNMLPVGKACRLLWHIFVTGLFSEYKGAKSSLKTLSQVANTCCHYKIIIFGREGNVHGGGMSYQHLSWASQVQKESSVSKPFPVMFTNIVTVCFVFRVYETLCVCLWGHWADTKHWSDINVTCVNCPRGLEWVRVANYVGMGHVGTFQ